MIYMGLYSKKFIQILRLSSYHVFMSVWHLHFWCFHMPHFYHSDGKQLLPCKNWRPHLNEGGGLRPSSTRYREVAISGPRTGHWKDCIYWDNLRQSWDMDQELHVIHIDPYYFPNMSCKCWVNYSLVWVCQHQIDPNRFSPLFWQGRFSALKLKEPTSTQSLGGCTTNIFRCQTLSVTFLTWYVSADWIKFFAAQI